MPSLLYKADIGGSISCQGPEGESAKNLAARNDHDGALRNGKKYLLGDLFRRQGFSAHALTPIKPHLHPNHFILKPSSPPTFHPPQQPQQGGVKVRWRCHPSWISYLKLSTFFGVLLIIEEALGAAGFKASSCASRAFPQATKMLIVTGFCLPCLSSSAAGRLMQAR
jgi:hypothetical protein